MTELRRFTYAIITLITLIGGATQLSAQTPLPSTLTVPLFPGYDDFGNQFEIVQAYENGNGQRSITMGIYDTGASVVSFSAVDQTSTFPAQLQPKIPIKVIDGATAEAIGGSGGTDTLTGDVSQPGKILVAGPGAVSFDINTLSYVYDLTSAVAVPGIQAFIGKDPGSAALPSLVGTPINLPSALNPQGLAAKIEQQGLTFDLGSIDSSLAGISFDFPNTSFVAPGTNLVPKATTYEAVRIPVQLFGLNNSANPGDEITAAPNPVQPHVTAALGANSSANNTFLFDTGAQLSVISHQIATQLGIVEGVTPSFGSIDVAGAAGTTSLKGYMIDSLTLPRADGGSVQFTNVPVYLLDIGSGIDGILGMNLFNGADSLLYDPYGPNGPEVQVTFLNDREIQDEIDGLADANQINALFGDALTAELLGGSKLAVQFTHTVSLPGTFVPEPSSGLLAVVGFIALAWRRRAHDLT